MKGLPFELIVQSSVEVFRAATFWEKEPTTIAWIKSLADTNDLLWDVGANIGLYSLYAASLNIVVTAFEPVQEYYDRLCQNIECNRLGGTVSPQRAALADEDKEVKGVELIRADTFVGSGNLPPDYVKIDVDGAELQVLRGMEKTLKSVKGLAVEITDLACGTFLYDNGFVLDDEFNKLKRRLDDYMYIWKRA
jgi:hypothetical protein